MPAAAIATDFDATATMIAVEQSLVVHGSGKVPLSGDARPGKEQNKIEGMNTSVTSDLNDICARRNRLFKALRARNETRKASV